MSMVGGMAFFSIFSCSCSQNACLSCFFVAFLFQIDFGPERLSKQRLRHQSCEFHFDMTPGKSVSRVPSRVVISTTLVRGCGHAGRGVRTNAGRRSSRSRQRHATDGVLTMTLRGDKVFCQLLYSLFCKSVCKPSCKLVYVNLFVHYSGLHSVHEYVDGFVRHFICHCCMAPVRLCVYAVYRLAHVLLSKLAVQLVYKAVYVDEIVEHFVHQSPEEYVDHVSGHFKGQLLRRCKSTDAANKSMRRNR